MHLKYIKLYFHNTYIILFSIRLILFLVIIVDIGIVLI